MIGQAIVKITKKSHTPPLLTTFGVTLSHLSGSAQLIHHADKLGISASYSAINNFEKNAALVCTDDIGTRCDGSNVNLCTWATDNVNFMKTDIAGKTMFDGLGTILFLMRSGGNGNFFGVKRIPKKPVKPSEILELKRNPLVYPPQKALQTLPTVLNVQWIASMPSNSAIDYLRVSSSIMNRSSVHCTDIRCSSNGVQHTDNCV